MKLLTSVSEDGWDAGTIVIVDDDTAAKWCDGVRAVPVDPEQLIAGLVQAGGTASAAVPDELDEENIMVEKDPRAEEETPPAEQRVADRLAEVETADRVPPETAVTRSTRPKKGRR